MGQLPLLDVFVSISILAVLGVPAVNVSLDKLPLAGDFSTADSRAMVVSPVVSLVPLPTLVLGGAVGSVGGVTGGVEEPLVSVIAGSGQFKPQRSSVALLADDPVVGAPSVPSQAAKANADRTKSDTDPIRMIFPTSQISHR